MMESIPHKVRAIGALAIIAVLVSVIAVMHVRDARALATAEAQLRDAENARQAAEARVYNPSVVDELAQLSKDIQDLESVYVTHVDSPGVQMDCQNLTNDAKKRQEELLSAPPGSSPRPVQGELVHRKISGFVFEYGKGKQSQQEAPRRVPGPLH